MRPLQKKNKCASLEKRHFAPAAGLCRSLFYAVHSLTYALCIHQQCSFTTIYSYVDRCFIYAHNKIAPTDRPTDGGHAQADHARACCKPDLQRLFMHRAGLPNSCCSGFLTHFFTEQGHENQMESPAGETPQLYFKARKRGAHG
jgi:hypothetical protein